MGLHLSLMIPGLWRPPRGAAIRLPALERLIARAQAATPAPGYEARMAACFGLHQPAIASLSYWADCGAPPGPLLRADPVHLQLENAGMRLIDSESLHLSGHEAEALVRELAQGFADEGWRLEAPHPGRWYLYGPTIDIATVPLPEVVGRDIQAHLPAGPTAADWRRRLNEAQMLLHRAPVNAAREARGEPAINSVWFWGEGNLPAAASARPFAQIWADEPVAVGLARWSGTPLAAATANWADWDATVTTAGHHLVVVPALRGAAQYGDVQAWEQGMQRLEHAWFAPALAALKRKRITSLSVYGDTGPVWQLQARAARRWWRRPRALFGDEAP